MTYWQIAIYAVVALWLAPGSLWRPCALALLLQWTVAEAVYAATGNRVPLPVYVVGDLLVITAFLLRPSHWSDWLIVMPYPAVWCLYALDETRAQWMALYWLSMGQMLVAGPWAQARREATIAGEFLQDVAGFIRSRMERVAYA